MFPSSSFKTHFNIIVFVYRYIFQMVPILQVSQPKPRKYFCWPYGRHCGPGSVVGIATGYGAGWSGDRIPVGGEIFGTYPDRPWGPPSLLYNGYRVFPGGKAAGAWRWPPTPLSAEVKERVELYLSSPSGPSWPVPWWTLPLLCKSRGIPYNEHNLRCIIPYFKAFVMFPWWRSFLDLNMSFLNKITWVYLTGI